MTLNSDSSPNLHFGTLLAKLMGLSERSSVLDVGTGYGGCLFPAMDKIGPNGEAVGIENEEEKVQKLLKVSAYENRSNVRPLLMDAQHLGFRDESFDFVVCGFVVNQLLDSTQSRLSNEMRRVLKKGGRIGFSAWDVDESLDAICECLRRRVSIPRRVLQLALKAERSSFNSYPLADLAVLVSEAGFEVIEKRSESFVQVYSDEEEWLRRSLAVFKMRWGRLREYADSMLLDPGDAETIEFHRTLPSLRSLMRIGRQEMLRFRRDRRMADGIHVRISANCVLARK